MMGYQLGNRVFRKVARRANLFAGKGATVIARQLPRFIRTGLPGPRSYLNETAMEQEGPVNPWAFPLRMPLIDSCERVPLLACRLLARIMNVLCHYHYAGRWCFAGGASRLAGLVAVGPFSCRISSRVRLAGKFTK